jgi:hypothetical protein
MRHYITFSLCDETGEADLTPKSRDLVEELIAEGNIFAADVLQDIYGISQDAYNRAYEAWHANSLAKMEAAKLRNAIGD